MAVGRRGRDLSTLARRPPLGDHDRRGHPGRRRSRRPPSSTTPTSPQAASKSSPLTMPLAARRTYRFPSLAERELQRPAGVARRLAPRPLRQRPDRCVAGDPGPRARRLQRGRATLLHRQTRAWERSSSPPPAAPSRPPATSSTSRPWSSWPPRCSPSAGTSPSRCGSRASERRVRRSSASAPPPAAPGRRR